jgi:putative transposase
MPHSYASLMVHVVFSTKDRKPQIDPPLEERLYPYLGGIVRELDGRLLTVNGVADHIHLLLSMNAITSTAAMVGKIKGCSSKWIHDTFPEHSAFAWQRGYAAFSVSQSQMLRVAEYIRGQKAHHATRSFRDEFLRLLRAHGVSPDDEKYLWT